MMNNKSNTNSERHIGENKLKNQSIKNWILIRRKRDNI